MGLLWFQNDPDSISRVLNAIADKFYADGVLLGCSPELTPPYRTRFFLSFLIGLFSLTGIWWFVLLPSILIYLLIGYIFWRIAAEFTQRLGSSSSTFFCLFFRHTLLGS
jgi:hypothetical protein